MNISGTILYSKVLKIKNVFSPRKTALQLFLCLFLLLVPFLVLSLIAGLIMFGGEALTSFVPEVGVQETMKEHGKDPLWKIRWVIDCFTNPTIFFPGLPSLIILTFVFVGTIPMEVLSSQPVKEASLESELLKSVVLFDVY